MNKYNDCMFNAIELSGVKLPKEISSQAKFKRFLGLDRGEPVDYKMIEKLQTLFDNVSFSVSGDKKLQMPRKHLNINLKLKNGTYKLSNNVGRSIVKGKHFKPVKLENVYIYKKLDDMKYKIYNGFITRTMNIKDFQKQKKDYNYCFLKADTADIEDEYMELVRDARMLYAYSDETIDIFRYQSYPMAALDVWQRYSKIYNYSNDLLEDEAKIINYAFQGGLTYANTGYNGFAVAYDINSFYPSCMINQYLNLPVEEPEMKYLSADEFNSLKYYQYGIYRAEIEKSSTKLFKYNKMNYYTHFDLTTAKELGLSIQIINENPNFYYYSKDKLIRAASVFEQFVQKMFDLKQQKCVLAKPILNCLWGTLAQKHTYKKIIESDDMVYNIPENAKLLHLEPHGTGFKIKYAPDKNRLFKRPEARFSPFILSFARMTFARKLKNYENNIVRIHTDGIYFDSDIETDFIIGTGLGEWKCEYKGEIEVIHLNKIKHSN